MTHARRSQTFVALPTSTGEARRLVTHWLRERGLAEFSDRVCLAVSELAANAVLHTGQPFTVTISGQAPVVRVEVVDSSPDRIPLRVPSTGSAVDIIAASETGRGLQIISALAHRWGVALDVNVKCVWAEFEGDRYPDARSDPTIVDKRPAPMPQEGLRHFRFIGLPVRSAIASGLDVEAALRDLQLRSLLESSAEADRFLALVDRSASLRLAGRHAAMHASSQNLLRFDLELDATNDGLAATAELGEMLAKMPRRPGSPGPTAEVMAFRIWLADEINRQMGGADPTPFPHVPALADEWLWEQATCGYVTMTPEGRIVRVNTRMLRWLDAKEPNLIGHDLVDLLDDASSLSWTEEFLTALISEGRVAGASLAFRRADGSRLRAHMNALVEHDDQGAPVCIRAAIDAVNATVPTEELRALEGRADESEGRAQELVRALQRTLIPPAPPVVPGLDVAATYHPAQGDVGGDFYDVFEVTPGEWCAVLGDVSGKGVEAAIVTAAARHAVRSSALREPVPSDLLSCLNTALLETATSRFCTVALLRLQQNHDAWVATLTSGGHPFPLLIRHRTATRLGRAGSLLGVFHEVGFHDVSIRLAVGDALVLYTDGVTEARNAAGEFFGEERLCDAAIRGAAHSAQAVVDAIMASVLAFQEGASDDIALVVVRRP